MGSVHGRKALPVCSHYGLISFLLHKDSLTFCTRHDARTVNGNEARSESFPKWNDNVYTSTMNSLYTSGVRQTNSIQADLERLRNGDNSPSLLGAYAVLASLDSLEHLG